VADRKAAPSITRISLRTAIAKSLNAASSHRTIDGWLRKLRKWLFLNDFSPALQWQKETALLPLFSG
jgi:hypothetical protein